MFQGWQSSDKIEDDTIREQVRNQRLEAILNQLPAITLICDTNLNVQDFGGKGLEDLSIDPIRYGEDPSVPMSNFVYNRENVMQYRKALNGGRGTYEQKFEGRHFQVHVRPFRNHEDEIIGALAVALDVTERKKKEHKLEINKERLQMALEGADAGTWELDLDTGTLNYDENFRTIMDLKVDVNATPFDTFLTRVDSRDRSRLETSLHEAEKSNSSFDIDFRTEGDSNRSQWFRVRGKKVPDEPCLRGVAFDITEQKQTEIALKESEQRFREMSEKVREVYWVVDSSLEETEYISPAIEDMFGYPPEVFYEEPGKFLDCLHPQDRDEVAEAYFNLEPGDVLDVEFRVEHPDRGIRWIWSHAYPASEDQGEPERIIGSNIDITERKEKERQLQVSQKRLQIALDAAGAGTWEWNTQEEELFWDENRQRLSGFDDEARTYTMDDFSEQVHPEDMEKVNRAIEESIDTEGDLQVDYRVKPRGEDEWRWFGARGKYFPSEQTLRGVTIDITERKRAREKLRQSERRFRQVTENMDNVFYLCDTDFSNAYYVSPAYEIIFGRDPGHLYADPWEFADSIVDVDREYVLNQKHQFLDNECEGNPVVSYRIRKDDGSVRWVRDEMFPVHDEEGNFIRVAGFVEDITDRKQLEEELKGQAYYDSLTDLPNRSLFENRLEMAIREQERSHRGAFAVLFLDLDDFKEINDLYGHSVGDRVLKKFAARVDEDFRPGDTTARFGGDEFIFLIKNIDDRKEVNTVLDRLEALFEEPITVDDHSFDMTGSVGIRVVRDQPEGAEAIIRDADVAMYEAKKRGGVTHEYYTSELRNALWKRRDLESNLTRGLKEDEFRVHYQPIVDVESGGTVGLEALVRWDHPEEGILQPARFLSQADDSNILPDIEQTVLEIVTRDVRDWMDHDAFQSLEWVSFNLSPQFFLEKNLQESLFPMIKSLDLDPSQFLLELNEKAALGKERFIQESLETIKTMGMKLAIDDFGTGYSSLNYLQQLSVDVLKIDRTFVSDMDENPDALKILEASLRLAESLDIQVIAEGAEEEHQVRGLESLDCQYVQGFYYSRPRPAGKIEREFLPASPAND